MPKSYRIAAQGWEWELGMSESKAQEEYIEALFECGSNDDKSLDQAASYKLMTMTKRAEYDLLIESMSEADDDEKESIMECMRASPQIDRPDAFDAVIGSIVRPALWRYMRPTIQTDYEQEASDRGWGEQADRDAAADSKYEAHKELRLAA